MHQMFETFMALPNTPVAIASLTIIPTVLGIYALYAIFHAGNEFSVVSSALTKSFMPNYKCTESFRNERIPEFTRCNCSNSVNVSACPAPSPVQEVEKEIVKQEQTPWYAEGKLWHYPIKFPRCSMDVCFNYSRCDNMQGDLLIFAYDVPGSPSWYFNLLKTTKWHTTSPEQACLFLVSLDARNPHPPHPRELPHWNGGMNHVLVTFADSWANCHVSDESIGFASLLITDMHETVYRPGFDISVAFPPKYRMTEFQFLKPFERKYLLTFRGHRVLRTHERGGLRAEDSFRQMHNGRDVIVAVSCGRPTDIAKIAQRDPAFGLHCDEDERIYANFSSRELMNSTFALAPAGRQSNSYRFAEVLSAGAIPVLIADNYVKPFGTLIQWHKCILQFPTSEMHRIVPTVRNMNRQEVEERQEYCLKVYNVYFKDEQALLKAAIDSLKARFMGVFPNLNPLTRF